MFARLPRLFEAISVVSPDLRRHMRAGVSGTSQSQASIPSGQWSRSQSKTISVGPSVRADGVPAAGAISPARAGMKAAIVITPAVPIMMQCTQ